MQILLDNVAIGSATLGANTTASNNVAIGYNAVASNTDGDGIGAAGS